MRALLLRMPRALTWVGLAALLAVLPWLFDGGFALSLLSQMGIAVILCLSYWLLMGQGGLLSFGHAVYSGAGAFMAIHTLRLVEAGAAVPVSLLPLAGGAVAALLALPLGWLATRQSSTAFAMITLGMGELAWAVAMMFPGVFGGESGISANRMAGPAIGAWSLGPAWQMYAVVAVYTLASALGVYSFTRSPPGRLLNAVRDNAVRVAFIGHDPRRLRLLAFVVAAFFAGIAGGLSALLHEIVSAEALASHRSAAVLVFTFVGGVGHVLGPVIGGVMMVLGQVVLSGWTPAWQLYLGLLFLGLVVFAPGGVAGWLLAPAMPRRVPWALRVGVVLAAALALTGLCGLIEMAYQLRLADTLGAERRFMGMTLDAHAASDWLGAGSLAVLAALAWWRLQRRLGFGKTP